MIAYQTNDYAYMHIHHIWLLPSVILKVQEKNRGHWMLAVIVSFVDQKFL